MSTIDAAFPNRGRIGRLPAKTTVAIGLAAAIGSVAAGWVVSSELDVRIALAAALGAAIVGLGAVAPELLLYVLIGWLAILGLARRLIADAFAASGADPLLLVGPLALGVLVAVAIHRGGGRRPTALTKAVAVLAALMLLGALNPSQGSLSAGITSLLYTLVPVTAFWIGRGLCTDRVFQRLLWVLTGFALATALYGLAQTFNGFPSWDQRWLSLQTDYNALGVYTAGGANLVTRPFGTYSSAAEYGYFVAAGLMVLVAAFLLRRARFLILPLMALLALAIFLEASRGIVVGCLIGATLMVVARRRLPLKAGVAFVAAAVLLVPVVLGQVNFGPASGGVGTLVRHQVGGLGNPLNPETSTLGTHVSLVVDGIEHAAHEPLGVGLSAVTIAGERLGATVQRPTGADPSNMAVALGIPGLVVYLVVVVLAFRRSYGLASRRRDLVALAALGLIAVTVLQWLNGGQYAVAWLPWLALGWMDRPSSDD